MFRTVDLATLPAQHSLVDVSSSSAFEYQVQKEAEKAERGSLAQSHNIPCFMTVCQKSSMQTHMFRLQQIEAELTARSKLALAFRICIEDVLVFIDGIKVPSVHCRHVFDVMLGFTCMLMHKLASLHWLQLGPALLYLVCVCVASERHAYSAHVICGLHQACLEAAPVGLCHALQSICVCVCVCACVCVAHKMLWST